MLLQVPSRSIEQLCCFWKGQAMLTDEVSTRLSVGDQSLALWPCCELDLWEDLIDGSHSSLGPLALYLLIQTGFEHRLHQAMHRERIVLLVATQQRKAQQGCHRFVQEGGIPGKALEVRPKFGCAFYHQLFWDSIGSKKGTKAQQVSSNGVTSFDLLKGEGPGGGDG